MKTLALHTSTTSYDRTLLAYILTKKRTDKEKHMFLINANFTRFL